MRKVGLCRTRLNPDFGSDGTMFEPLTSPSIGARLRRRFQTEPGLHPLTSPPTRGVILKSVVSYFEPVRLGHGWHRTWQGSGRQARKSKAR